MNKKYSDIFNKGRQEEMKDFFIREVGPLGRVERYRRGATLCKDVAEDLYIVKKGRINILLNEAGGEEQLIYKLVRGELLGDFEVLSGVGQNYTLHFLEESELWRVPRKIIEAALTENRDLYPYLIHSMTRKYNLALYQVSFNRFYTGEERIAEFLIRLSRSRNPEKTRYIGVEGYTHEDIGNNVNLSRVGVTNILKKLAERELIEVRRRLIVVVSLERLEEYREELRRKG